MIQQINLYPQNETFSGRPLWLQPYVLLLGLTLAGFALTSFLDWQALEALQQQRQTMQQSLQTATAEVLKLQAQLPSEQSHALLDQELQQSLKVLQSLSHIVELLADDQSDRTQGVSHYYSALVQEVDAAVWLRRIHIDTASNRISLHGSSFKADAIPVLLQRLQNTEAFKPRHFARMSITESKEVAGQVDFVVSSDPEKEKGDAN
jgi:hypothetical protein